MRRGMVGLAAFIVVYVASIVLYVDSGIGHAHRIGYGPPSAAQSTVRFDIEDIQANNGLLRANVSVTPAPQLLDPVTHKLKDDLSVEATSTIAASKRTWARGTLPDVFPVSLTLTGDVADWPFDSYQSGPVGIELLSGPAQVPQPAAGTLIDRLLGWKIGVTRLDDADAAGPYQLDLYRSPSTAAFGLGILGVLVTLAGLALFVAVQTLRNRRRFQPPMTTWYAAMLFAVMPLRGALPDPPPFGSWIDITVVFWVIVVLVISLVLYITCWWQHLRPDTEPADGAGKIVRKWKPWQERR